LNYDSEAWTICKQDKSRIKAVELKFMRRTGGCTRLGYEQNFDVMKELNVQSWNSQNLQI